MIRFSHTEYLLALALIPAFLLIFGLVRLWRKNAIKRLGEQKLVAPLLVNISTGKPVVKIVLWCAAYAFLVVGIAGPQMGTRTEEVKREGVEIVIALDVSNSMMAEDLSPNRLERGKRALAQLVEQLNQDKLGIVVFAGEAFVQLPITTDYAAAKLFLDNIETGLVGTQGTAIGNAIDLCLESFDPNSPASKVIVVMTDGENHEDDAIEAAQRAKASDILVHTVGMGSADGRPIPMYKRGKQIGYRQDQSGNTIVTQLNEDMLREIAVAGGGIYTRATNAHSGLNVVMEEVGKLEKTEFGSTRFTDYEDRFQYLIALALFFLIVEAFISFRKTKWLSQINLFSTSK